MDASAISLTARQMRDYLATELSLSDTNIFIDHPSQTYKDVDKTQHGLNLFFYRVESGGFLTGGSSQDPFYIKMHCLITALAIDDKGSVKVSAGENDLKLIGGVVASLHSQPIFMLQDDQGRDIAEVQLVMQSLNLEELNHIWSTQGDIAYRPSVAYEIGLAPAPFALPTERSPRVASVAQDLAAAMTDAVLNDDWLPSIRFKVAGQWVEGLSVDTTHLPSSVEVACVGVAGTEVSYVWEVWSSTGGWSDHPLDPVPTATIVDSRFLGSTPTTHLDMPIDVAGQAMLYAVRNWQRPDQQTVKLRSNPLLIVVGEGS